MRKQMLNGGAALLAVASLVSWPLMAADHLDSPQAAANPTADIDDVFAWMTPNAQRLNLVMTIGRDVAPGFQFSDSVDYIFRVRSRSGLLADSAVGTDVLCTFTTAQAITCSVGDATVSGNASGETGITSNDGRLRVFAGQRNDPFFFNLNGFRATAEIVAGAASSLTFDDNMCPALDEATSNALVTQLRSEPNGDPAIDDFADSNVLAIVLQVDKALVNSGGDILGVSGFTNIPDSAFNNGG